MKQKRIVLTKSDMLGTFHLKSEHHKTDFKFYIDKLGDGRRFQKILKSLKEGDKLIINAQKSTTTSKKSGHNYRKKKPSKSMKNT